MQIYISNVIEASSNGKMIMSKSLSSDLKAGLKVFEGFFLLPHSQIYHSNVVESPSNIRMIMFQRVYLDL